MSDQVELLQTELKLMQGLLKDADGRQDESDILRQWVAETRDLAYDAEDIIATYALKVTSRKEGRVLKRCACILYEGITVHKVGSQIVNIKAKISILKTSFRDYGVRESIIQGGGSGSLNERQREQRETYSYLEDDVVGFDNDVKKLVEFMLREEGNRIASICGYGWSRKDHSCQDGLQSHIVKRHFDCRAWVYVSQQCQRRHVWEEILISLQSKDRRDEIKKMSDAELVEELRQVQQKQKCLVILDDIWTIEAWNSLCEAFPKKNTGSKILLTSRNKDVSLHADPRGFLHELQHLNDKWSLELLEKIISHRKGTSNI